MKLEDGPRSRGARRCSTGAGSGRAVAVPDVPSILPLPLLPGPADPRERDRRLPGVDPPPRCRSGPTGLVCLTGPAGDLEPVEARRIVVAGLRELAAEAEQAGSRSRSSRISAREWRAGR